MKYLYACALTLLCVSIRTEIWNLNIISKTIIILILNDLFADYSFNGLTRPEILRNYHVRDVGLSEKFILYMTNGL